LGAETDVLRSILDALPAHIALLDKNGFIRVVNESWRRFAAANMLDCADFFVGQNYLQVCERARGECVEEARAAARGICDVIERALPEFSLEYPCHSETELRWFKLMVTPLAGNSGGTVITHVNITERKLAELKLARINRLYLVLSRINEGIVRAARVEDVFHTVCRVMVEDGGFRMAAVVSPKLETGIISPLATYPPGDSYLAEVPLSISDPRYSEGTIGRCLRSGKLDVCNDLANDPRVSVWKSSFMPRGYRASGSFPISVNGQIFAALVLFAGEKNYFATDEIKLLQTVAEDLSFAVESLQAEASSRERQTLLNNAQRIGRMGSWSIDLRSKRLAWSEATCEIFGISQAEFQESLDHFLSFIIPEDRPGYDAGHARLSTDNPLLECVYRIRRPDGQVRVLFERGNVEFDQAGNQLRRIGMVMDITEQQAARQALAQSEQRFKLLFELAPDPIFLHDLEGKFVAGNKAAELCIGYPREELIGQSFLTLNLLPPADLAKARDSLQLCADGKPVGPLELTLNRKDGSTVQLEILSYPLVVGNESLVLGIGRDVTGRNRADLQLRDQAKLLDAAHEAIIVKTLDGVITYWNKGAERLFGWTREEIVGRCCFDTFYKDPLAFKRLKPDLLSKGLWEGEAEKITKDGRTLTVQVSLTVVHGEQGAPQSILAINSDITEKKLLEAQFLRAQRMESIGTLAGGIAHDLNNVLAPIMFSIELLKPLAKSAEDESLLDTLTISARRGADLVKQVLSFARGMEGQRIVVNVAHLVRDLAKVMKETFPKDIEITFKPAAKVWTVTGDPTQIHQVILNLCVNARDAMPNGGKLSLTVENITLDETYSAMNPESRPGPYVLIHVSDTGTGITREARDRIFEPFFTTKDVGKGTGLGLSTAMAIVKSHRGFINLDTEVGKGTKFKVYFPADASSEPSTQQPTDQTKLPKGNGELILVVDDEEAIRDIARRSLERFGYRVVTASNGAEAISVYVTNQNDVSAVVTDMAMPIMDGPALIIALKSINPEVRIIASSGLTSNGGVAKAIGAGVHHFIPKPYTAEAILNALDQLLHEPNSRN
jgi:PAS domain S-box-containing protein